MLCSDNTFYTGITSDIEKRVSQHQQGIAPDSYTHSRRPVKLVYFEEYQYVHDAISREKQIKDWSQAKKKALIDKDMNKLKKHAISISRQARNDT